MENNYKMGSETKTLKYMKQKQSKTIYTPNKSFECKIPLDWNGVIKKLTIAINRYNRSEQRKWENSSFLHRIFTRPANYKVEVQEAADPEMVKIYQETYHHRVWIENTRKKRMHFDVICCKQSVTNSMFLQDGVKYNHFLLMAKDTSVRWLDKKHLFLHDILPFIDLEV